jgi:hypothetical protein
MKNTVIAAALIAAAFGMANCTGGCRRAAYARVETEDAANSKPAGTAAQSADTAAHGAEEHSGGIQPAHITPSADTANPPSAAAALTEPAGGLGMEAFQQDAPQETPTAASDFIVKINKAGTGAIITGYTGKAARVIIPATLQGLPVVTVRGFLENKSIREVVLSSGIREIGTSAFWGCASLTGVSISQGMKKIGDGAFAGCTALIRITIPQGVTEIGYRAFENCTALTKVTILPGPAKIAERTFKDCAALTSVNLPQGITEIGDGAFAGCAALTGITVPEGVTKIDRYAFWGCASLTRVNIPKSIEIMGSGVFENCTGLKAVTIPDTVTRIQGEILTGWEHVFLNCPALSLESQAAIQRIEWF